MNCLLCLQPMQSFDLNQDWVRHYCRCIDNVYYSYLTDICKEGVGYEHIRLKSIKCSVSNTYIPKLKAHGRKGATIIIDDDKTINLDSHIPFIFPDIIETIKTLIVFS